MKEKTWKLLELLNEYSKNIWYFNEEDLQWQTKAWILSKEFWWIKWLVENDKIDTNKLEKIWYEKTVYQNYWQYREIVEYSDYESLLMLLSISDTPIDLLCSLLK